MAESKFSDRYAWNPELATGEENQKPPQSMAAGTKVHHE
jgi:hypothetical protein